MVLSHFFFFDRMKSVCSWKKKANQIENNSILITMQQQDKVLKDLILNTIYRQYSTQNLLLVTEVAGDWVASILRDAVDWGGEAGWALGA